MGRAGANGIVRDGFIDVGDPFNGWDACSIEEVSNGVPVGVARWNTLNTYNPVGGINGGNSYTLYGALTPFTELLRHLQAALGAQPQTIYEYWTGSAWAALTMITTADYTCAGGILNQRAKWVLPSNWATATPAQLGLALANPGTYFYMRERLQAGIVAGPVANANYKDFLSDRFTSWYSHFGIKRGDDGTGSLPTSFYCPGDTIIRFRDGFSLEGRLNVGGNRHQFGSEDTTAERTTLSCGGTVIASPGKGPVVNGGAFFGVMFMGRPRHASQNQLAAFRSNILPLKLHATMLLGCFGGAATALGGAASAAIRSISNSRATLHPIYDGGITFGLFSPYAISLAADAFVDRLVIDIRANLYQYGIRSTIAGGTRIEGVQFTSDAVLGGLNSAQLYLIGASGQVDIVNMEWGGPNDKVEYNGSNAFEWRPNFLVLLENDSVTPVPAGIPFRLIKSDLSVHADGLTDANGVTEYAGPGISLRDRRQVPASVWNGAGGSQETETLLDEPYYFQLNPADHASFNPAYMSLIVRGRFPRAILLDRASGLYTERDWQRLPAMASVVLPRAVVAAVSQPIMVDDLPLPLAWEQQIEAEVPEIR